METRQTSSGAIIDYVDARTLYPDSPDAPFATPPSSRPATNAGVGRGLGDLQADDSLRPPAGTIPVPRSKFSHYVQKGDAYKNLDDYFANLPQPTPNVSSTNRLYASHRDVRSNIGSGGWINLWRYSGVGSSHMSLMQNAMLCYGASSSTTMEAIEMGFQVLPSFYDDSDLHFFSYFRTAGKATGDRVGGYNLTVAGFIQAAGAGLAPGGTINSATLSTVDGTQYECQVETELFAGNWWLYACGSWLGYYPTQHSTSVAAGSRITFDLIGSSACQANWYGEVFDGSPSTWTNADIGGGGYAADGWARAGYMREPFLQLNSATWDWMNGTPISGAGYDPNCYTQSNMFSNGGTGWTRWFYLGGPGGSAAACD